MGGKKKILIGLLGLFMLLVWVGTASAIEYGKFSVSGWVRNQIALNIGQQNPNNYFWNKVEHDYSRETLKMFRTAVQLKPQYTFSDNVSVFARVLAANEQANWDSNVSDDVDWFPKSYDGDMQVSSDNWMLGMKELYVDVDSQFLWLRLGKQQVSWGQSDGLRLLDIINPIDKTWHGISLNEPYLDAFDNLRESLWMARATLKSPWETENLQDVQLEFLWIPGKFIGSEYVGSINPVHGSPYNFEPDAFINTDVKPGGQEWGARLMGKFKSLEWSLNYFRHYEDDGLYHLDSLTADNHAYSHTDHPRVDSYGFSLTYDDNMMTKAVYRFELLYQPNKPYESRGFVYFNGLQSFPERPLGPMYPTVGPGDDQATGLGNTVASGPIETRKTVKALLGIDRPTIIPFLNPNRTISLGFQAFVIQILERGNKVSQDGLTLNGGQVTETTAMFSFSANTGYMQDRINPSLLYIFDTGRGVHYLQLGTEFRITDHILWYVGANFYGGSQTSEQLGQQLPNGANDNLGYFSWADEVQSRLTFQF
jgi:hypothetical protein